MNIKFNEQKFTKVLREFRGERTQADIAESLGINRATLSLLETGKQIPSIEILQKLCENVGLNADTFFDKESDDPILLMMGQFKEPDKPKLYEVLERINIREKYLSISKR